MIKKFLPLLTILFLGLIFPKIIFAQDFAFDYDVTYEVKETGETQVNYNVLITNLKTQLYAQNYVLLIASENLTDISATDIFGPITPQINKKTGQTQIILEFPQPVVGIKQKHPFTIKFKTHDIAVKKGRIWEILIPGSDISSETKSYLIKLIVPKSFGQPAYSVPTAKTFGLWTLDEHQGQGIRVTYGDFQAFDLRLKYFLENKSNSPVLKEITLPPDTAYQKLIYKRLSVMPQNVLVDADGNYLAQYVLNAYETKDIELEAQSWLYLFPQKYVVSLTPTQLATYTKPLKFWNLSQQNLKLMADLNTARQIYDFTVKNITYDYEQVTQKTVRQGADGVLNNKDNALCLEFSDLFVAMARAKNIPARAIHGYAYTTNSRIQPLSVEADILHAWAEYYDKEKQSWVQVDPTWGNTTKGIDYFSKFDFNHIAFAILGSESDYPYPAGAFRDTDDDKTVFVNFSQDLSVVKPDLQVQAIIPNLKPGKNQTAYIEISNKGNVSQTIATLQLKAPVSETVVLDITLPPYGTIRYPFALTSPLTLKQLHKQFFFTVNGEQFIQNYIVLPLYLTPEFFLATVIILGVNTLLILNRGNK